VNKSFHITMLAICGIILLIVVWVTASRTTHEADLRAMAPEQGSLAAAASGDIQPANAVVDASPSGAVPRALVDDDDHEPTEAEIERRREDNIRRNESSFIAEPMDPAWSSKQSAVIGGALKPDSMSHYGAPAPRRSSVDCRSRHCRIEAIYDNSDQAELGQYALAAGIGGALPATASFMVDQPDGTTRLIIFADSVPPAGHR
jgi:hypothetical protein